MRKVNKAIPPRHNPADVEGRLYRFWEDNGFFSPEGKGEPYCIVIPPPNITGSLHMGHALNNSIQDCLARWKRMEGKDVLWMPGVDHAGIATQNVVDRELRSEGSCREEFGREEFVRRIWKWKEKYGGDIVSQLRLLGSSCDWSRLRFTMDERYSEAVIEEFVSLYEQGYIYRGDRLINWCIKCRTALSDIEVEYEEAEGRLYHIKYPVDGDSFITVATTRPETMLGDAAVAVHPKDQRYGHLAGKEALLPLAGRRIRVVPDDRVDMEFGTGAVKVTPAHDALDFEIGMAHELPIIKVIGEDGVMTAEAGDFAGQDRHECRKNVLAELRKQGLLVKEEPHTHSAGRCYRCAEVIEPLVSLQWFVKMEELSLPAASAVRDGSVRFIPERWKGVYINWMDNIRDWCVSRQIWWGHRIPAWYCGDCGFVNVARTAPEACGECGSEDLTCDEDVLDTWFSSALWPFAGLGWPEETEDLGRFYPTSALVTGHEIIYFWVARMIMTGIKFMGRPPFSDVYIHGIVRDSAGRKMSKSMGNVVDPRDIIKNYGTDALRLTLLSNLGGQDIKFGEDRLEGMRNFVNKLWNAGRFIMMNLEDGVPPDPGREKYNLDDRWILSEAQALIRSVTDNLESYKFSEACQEIYDFIWHKFCDWYLELAKPRLAGGDERAAAANVLLRVWADVIKLLHPFAPFISEELWGHIPGPLKTSESVMKAPWPEPGTDLYDRDACRLQEKKFDVIRTARRLRLEQGLQPSRKAAFEIATADEEERRVLAEGIEGLKILLNASEVSFKDEAASEGKVAGVTESGASAYIKLDESDRKKHAEKLRKELAGLDRELQSCRGKLANEKFLSRAPEAIVEKERGRERELLLRRGKTASHLENLQR